MVPTGLHIPDSALFLQAMYMFDTDFYSPYAAVYGENTQHNFRYFAIPHLWFYGLQGFVAGSLGLDYFLFYGFINGLCAGLFLYAAYRFLRCVVPKAANWAFVIFALGGGLGGILYVITGVLGLHGSQGFEQYFWRYAVYELLEGAHLFPVTYYARSYYTFSLACGLGAFTFLVKDAQRHDLAYGWIAAGLMILGTFVDARFGAFTAAAALLYVLNRRIQHQPAHWKTFALFLCGSGLGYAASFGLMLTNPTIIRNHLEVGNMAVYFSPFLSAAALLLPLFVWECLARMRAMAPPWRILTGAGLGYLSAFAVLFALYQLYYGNILVAHDAAVAVAISDWALIGGVLGALRAWVAARREPRPPHPNDNSDWIVVWALGFLCLSISAFGHGWFLRLGPQRLMVPMYLPLSIVAALGLLRIWQTRPRVARTWARALVTCGVVTILIATFHFQAPIGRKPTHQPYDDTMTYAMTKADAKLVSQIGQGEVLALPPASDIVALRMTRTVAGKEPAIQSPQDSRIARAKRHGLGVAFGIGTFNMNLQPYVPLRRIVERYFEPQSTEAERRDIRRYFETDYVYVSDTWPVHMTNMDLRGQIVRVGHGALSSFLDEPATMRYSWSSRDADSYLNHLVKVYGP